MGELPDEVVDHLRQARAIVFFTGTGMSAESGVPTFRDKGMGLWERYRTENLATREAFRRQPGLVWSWYEWRRLIVQRAQPHTGHLAMARVAAARESIHVVTQNVDDLHERAGSKDVGSPARKPVRASVLRMRQTARRGRRCGELRRGGGWRLVSAEVPPLRCQGPPRRRVVWGITAGDAWRRARTLASECDALIVVGTSLLVQPAVELPLLALRRGAIVVQIDPQMPTSTYESVAVQGTAAQALPALMAQTGWAT